MYFVFKGVVTRFLVS